MSQALPTAVTDSADIIVIGGGAAGLMCALTAGQRGVKV
jgi:predicted flavoprotein YhiN